MGIQTGTFRGRGAIAVALVAALATTTLAASPSLAGKKKKKKKVERVEQRDYIGATGVRGAADTSCAGEPVGCVVFPIEEGEKFVQIEVEDSSGEPVWASIYVYGYTDGTDVYEHVCGASEFPFALAEGLTELVVVLTQTTGGVTNPCAGAATMGTVTATFSNIP